MLSVMAAARHDPFARMLNADLIAVLVAVLLPWSTSGVGIGMLIWLAALAATLELRPFLRSLERPISALPIALVALAAVGTLWSEASWGARLYALSPATKLLFLPLLFYHFARSTRGMWVFVAFLASCTLLTVAFWMVAIDPGLSLKASGEPTGHGIFVKNYIDQSQEFVLCTVVLVFPIITLLRAGKIRPALLLTAVVANFILNMVFVVVSRTALVTLPVMLAVFAMAHLKRRMNVLLSVAAVVLGALAWTVSPQLQATTDRFAREYRIYKELNQPTSIGLRLELLFRREGLAAWIGLMVVLQNVFSSLFNSHLFDFHEGWMYVLGVGIAGGIVLRARPEAAESSGTAWP
jgi:hypothetical protein